MIGRSQDTSGLRFPPGISCSKESPSHAPTYAFRHETLGPLGRIVLWDMPSDCIHITAEVAGEQLDPSTAQRIAVFEPLMRQIVSRLDELKSGSSEPDAEREKSSPAISFIQSKEPIDSQLIPCGRCGEDLALFIFAPGATDAGRFEDYVRRMYLQYSRLNVVTWIIGPALGDGPIMDRPADMLKVWPEREPVSRRQPATLHIMLDELQERHCV